MWQVGRRRGLHGLACRRSAPRQQRHCHMNDIIHAVKEPVGLMRQDGKRPHGTTILPWSRGKPLAWEVTVPDTCRCTCVQLSQTGRRCSHSPSKQQDDQVYSQLARIHIFYPVAIETAGTWHDQAVELIREIERRTTTITGDAKETIHVPVPGVVCGTPKGKRGLLSKHVHYQLSRCNKL